MIEDTMFDNDCYAVFVEEEHEKERRMEDLISRQAAINAIPQTAVDMFEDCRNCGLLYREDVIRILSDLPSVNIKQSKKRRINETEIL